MEARPNHLYNNRFSLFRLDLCRKHGVGLMTDWNELLEKQKEERLALFQSKIDQGFTPSQTARELGMSRQSVYQFCKVHNLSFKNKDVIE